MPIRRRSGATTELELESVLPFQEMFPAVGASKPAIPRSRVDLPHPLGPKSAPISPGCNEKEASSTTGASPYASETFSRDSTTDQKKLVFKTYCDCHPLLEMARFSITTGTAPISTIVSEGNAASTSLSSDASS